MSLSCHPPVDRGEPTSRAFAAGRHFVLFPDEGPRAEFHPDGLLGIVKRQLPLGCDPHNEVHRVAFLDGMADALRSIEEMAREELALVKAEREAAQLCRYHHVLSDGTVAYSTGLTPTQARAEIWSRVPLGVRVLETVADGPATR